MTPDGGRKFFKANYFLSDSTIEIKELKQINTGIDPFPMLLRRQKLAKEPISTHCPGLNLKSIEYFKPQDFLIGNTIRIYDKDFFIYSCDSSTREWYKLNMNYDQKPIPLHKRKEWAPPQPVPPYNGYGTEADSMANVLKLKPKPQAIDQKKFFDNDMNILRFEAKLLSQDSLDAEREFMISFYCCDDSVMVFENAQRNSGRQPCKYQERNKYHKNPKTEQYYKDVDFQIGETIVLNQSRFLLTKADDFTHHY